MDNTNPTENGSTTEQAMEGKPPPTKPLTLLTVTGAEFGKARKAKMGLTTSIIICAILFFIVYTLFGRFTLFMLAIEDSAAGYSSSGINLCTMATTAIVTYFSAFCGARLTSPDHFRARSAPVPPWKALSAKIIVSSIYAIVFMCIVTIVSIVGISLTMATMLPYGSGSNHLARAALIAFPPFTLFIKLLPLCIAWSMFGIGCGLLLPSKKVTPLLVTVYFLVMPLASGLTSLYLSPSPLNGSASWLLGLSQIFTFMAPCLVSVFLLFLGVGLSANIGVDAGMEGIIWASGISLIVHAVVFPAVAYWIVFRRQERTGGCLPLTSDTNTSITDSVPRPC